LSDREPGEGHNRVASIDGRFRLSWATNNLGRSWTDHAWVLHPGDFPGLTQPRFYNYSNFDIIEIEGEPELVVSDHLREDGEQPFVKFACLFQR